jgi:hypothetical protein
MILNLLFTPIVMKNITAVIRNSRITEIKK